MDLKLKNAIFMVHFVNIFVNLLAKTHTLFIIYIMDILNLNKIRVILLLSLHTGKKNQNQNSN